MGSPWTRAICRVTGIGKAGWLRWSLPSYSYGDDRGRYAYRRVETFARETVHPGMIDSQVKPPAEDEALGKGAFAWTPEKWDHGQVTVVLSSANEQA